jgi:SAM-dependent methyltransferase
MTSDARAERRLEHPTTGWLSLSPRPEGRWLVTAHPEPGLFCPRYEIETSYPPELIEALLPRKGAAYLVDEVARDEDPGYTAGTLLPDILSYVDPEFFRGKTVLDFGCGLGASTCILGRALPEARIVGIDLNQWLLDGATQRARHHGLKHVTFLRSPAEDALPPELPPIDHVVLSAVYEHMLPHERAPMLERVWRVMKPGGVLFLDQTPHRWFPIDVHTTYLPLINYLPDGLAYAYARKCSKLVGPNHDWPALLRDGIRGATQGEILGILRRIGDGVPVLLKPERQGARDIVDVWFNGTTLKRWPRGRTAVRFGAKVLRALTGIEMVPYLALAIRKNPVS